jgi:N-acetylmuramoyl-L-alanine amidase
MRHSLALRLSRRTARNALLWGLLALVVWLGQGPLLGSPSSHGSELGADLDRQWKAQAASSLAGAVFVVDPGHGGRDPGAIAGAVYEKDIVLPVALLIRGMLEEAGAAVVMTRETDVDLSEDLPGQRKRTDLQARVDLINDLRPDMVLSIHANSFSASRWRGPQVFYNPKDARNRLLAQAIQVELVQVVGVRREIALDQRQYILREVLTPIVCIEIGFLTNPEDLRLMQDPDGQRRIAYAICRGALAYLSQSLVPATSSPGN